MVNARAEIKARNLEKQVSIQCKDAALALDAIAAPDEFGAAAGAANGVIGAARSTALAAAHRGASGGSVGGE